MWRRRLLSKAPGGWPCFWSCCLLCPPHLSKWRRPSSSSLKQQMIKMSTLRWSEEGKGARLWQDRLRDPLSSPDHHPVESNASRGHTGQGQRRVNHDGQINARPLPPIPSSHQTILDSQWQRRENRVKAGVREDVINKSRRRRSTVHVNPTLQPLKLSLHKV